MLGLLNGLGWVRVRGLMWVMGLMLGMEEKRWVYISGKLVEVEAEQEDRDENKTIFG